MTIETLLKEKITQKKSTHLQAFDIGKALVHQHHYLDALDRFKLVLKHSSRKLPDILIYLYKKLATHSENLQLHFLIAELYFYTKQFKESLLECEEITTIDPEFSRTYILLSKMYSIKEVKQNIIDIFEQAFNSGAKDTAILDFLPKYYLETQNHAKLINFYETLTIFQPLSVGHLKALATAYIKANQFEEAAKTYESILKIAPHDAEYLAQHCEQMLALVPQNINVRKTFINFLIKSWDPAKASREIRLILNQDPNFLVDAIKQLKHILTLFPDTPVVLENLAHCLIKDKQYSEAVTYITKVFELNKEKSEIVIEICSQILANYPKQVMAMQLLSDVYLQLEQFEMSLQYISDLIELNTNDLDSLIPKIKQLMIIMPSLEMKGHYLLSKIYFNLNNFDESQKEASKLQNSEFHSESKLLIASIYRKKGHFKQALSILQEALNKAPFDWQLHQGLKFNQDSRIIHKIQTLTQQKNPIHQETNLFILSTLFLCQGNYEKALEIAQQLVEDPNQKTQAQLLMSRCFLETGRSDLALTHLESILSTKPLDKEKKQLLLFKKGMIKLSIGQLTEALSAFEEISTHNINFNNLNEMIQLAKSYSQFDLRGQLISGCLSNTGPIQLMTIPNQESLDTDVETSISFAHPHNNKGVEFMLKQHFKAAEEAFKLAIQMDESYTASYVNIAVLCLYDKRYEEAEYYLAQAEKRNLNLDAIPLTRGLSFLMQSEPNLAQIQLTYALNLNDKNPLTHLNMGDIYYHQKSLENAFNHWNLSLQTGRHLFVHIFRRLSYLKLNLDQFDDWALDFWMNFLSFDPFKLIPPKADETVEQHLLGFEELILS